MEAPGCRTQPGGLYLGDWMPDATRESQKQMLRTKHCSLTYKIRGPIIIDIRTCSHFAAEQPTRHICQQQDLHFPKCPGCIAAATWKAKAVVHRNVSCLMHKKMSSSVFQELLSSANLLSSVKFSRVNFRAKDKSPDIHIVNNIYMSESVQVLFIQVYTLLTVGKRLDPDKNRLQLLLQDTYLLLSSSLLCPTGQPILWNKRQAFAWGHGAVSLKQEI